MRKLCGIFIAIMLSLPVFSEARNALLIANSNYTNISKLGTPINEARELKQTLVKLGFSVTTVENGSKEKMLSAIASFSEKLKKENGIGFFHYGGHAVQLNGKNWLIPVNADVPDALRVTCNCIELDTIMSYMYAETNIVVIDACRDSPLPQGGVRGAGEKRGLVMTVPRIQNSIVVFSAGDGETAQDGVFTPLLTKKLLEKKLLNEIIIDVRNEVLRLTNNAQYPETKDRLVSKVYLAGNASGGQNYVPQTSSASSDPKTADEYYNLGVVAFNEKNYTTAAEYYKKAILINEIHKEALNNLGYCYEKGFGVTQNYAKAEELYRKSANLGHVTAQNNLGDLYYFGKGVSQDFSEAKKWYLKAAEQGYAYGQYNVGWLFEHGHGVNKNINTALSYYQMAANQGNEDAKKRIAAINASNNTNASVQNNGKWLFPLYGIELGKTPVSELKKKGKKDKKYDLYEINGQNFWYKNNVFDHMYVTHTGWISEWSAAGYDKNLSYNEWISFLKSQGYEIFITEKPKNESYKWIKTPSLSAKIVARRNYPVNHGIELDFNYSGKTSLSASGTLYSISVGYNGYSFITRKDYPDDGSGSSSSSSSYSTTSSSQWLFPVYGLELGKSSESEVRRKSEQKVGDRDYYVNGHDFECNENGKLSWVQFFDPIGNPWPQEIINKGYNPNYSYNQWKSFLISQGYTITKYATKDKIDAEKSSPIKHELFLSFRGGKCSGLRIDIE